VPLKTKKTSQSYFLRDIREDEEYCRVASAFEIDVMPC